MLKKLLVGVSVLTLLLAGCMSHEYADKIDKAVKLQEKKQQKIANKDFNAKAYYQSHEPDYKEENMY